MFRATVLTPADDHKGFTLIELLIVVAVIAIVAAIAIPGLIRARISGNEASAIGSMRTINSGQTAFASTCGAGGYDITATADGLSTEPVAGSPAFIPTDLSSAFNGTSKSGYDFALADHPDGSAEVLAADICASGVRTTTGFFATGAPRGPGSTGVRYFASDNTGWIRQDVIPLVDMTDGIPMQ